MRTSPKTLFALLVVGLTSCDYSMHISVRNYKEPCRVDVTYEKAGSTFFDSDTLAVKMLASPRLGSSLLRVNTSANTYFFTAPREREVVLNPISLGNSIKDITIANSPDSFWTIHLWDRHQLRKVKRSGQIKTSGFIFWHAISIENR